MNESSSGSSKNTSDRLPFKGLVAYQFLSRRNGWIETSIGAGKLLNLKCITNSALCDAKVSSEFWAVTT